MPQPGSQTTITVRTRLILLDCFETLVELDGDRYRPRLGIPKFLRHFTERRPVPLAVISDAPLERIGPALQEAGVPAVFAGIWHAGDAIEEVEGRLIKRLDVPLRALGVAASEAIYIGDSPYDEQAAIRASVPFIRVPRSEDRQFSFATLIDGPSRYDSAQFTTAFLRRYKPEQP